MHTHIQTYIYKYVQACIQTNIHIYKSKHTIQADRGAGRHPCNTHTEGLTHINTGIQTGRQPHSQTDWHTDIHGIHTNMAYRSYRSA